MTNQNQFPGNPEVETFAHQEVIQFNDGEMALGFRTPGDSLPLGLESHHKYAKHFDLGDMAIIQTRSGNAYALAGGLVINRDRQRAYELPEDTIQVTVGEPCVIPGVGTTTNVERVMLRYKMTQPGSSMAGKQIDAPSPFKALQEQVNKINATR